MRGRILVLTLGLVGIMGVAAVGQGGRSRVGGPNFPKVGAMLPEVSVFDEQGERFSTQQLRGEYAVLVFGCLT